MNLKDLIKLASRDGKIVVIGDDGEVKGVFLSYDEYARLAGVMNAAGPAEHGPNAEKVNREILEAQLNEHVDLSNKNLETVAPLHAGAPNVPLAEPWPIKNILARRARDLFASQPYGRQEPPEYDPRQEVVDPNFGSTLVYPPLSAKPAPAASMLSPRVETDGDEEIRPNFDDI